MSDEGSPLPESVNGDVHAENSGLSDGGEDGHVKHTIEQGSDDEGLEEEINELGDDLFGDEEDEDAEPQASKRRQLDDEELDSGDDEGRTDRFPDGEDEGEEDNVQNFNYMDLELSRHAIPEPSDNELYLLKVPRFLSLDPHTFSPQNFTPPTTDHHSHSQASAAFSVYNTAMTTLRWRPSPTNPSELQSNARILRWSDGSLTLQLASDPTVQYEIDAKMLAPPQRNPPKPTPTSKRPKGRQNQDEGYDPSKDSFTYLTAPNSTASILRITSKITTGLSILPNLQNTENDDAIEQLRNSLAKAAQPDIAFIGDEAGYEDPEKARRRAEAAEKEKNRVLRQQERLASRQAERRQGMLGRSTTFGTTRSAGLTIGALEDEDGGGRARARPKARKPRRGEIYSEDEDEYRGHRTREDEYDEEDDFVAPSDEEPMLYDDDEPEEEELEDEEDERPRRAETPKRPRESIGDAGEGGDVRTKRRRVIEDDEDDE